MKAVSGGNSHGGRCVGNARHVCFTEKLGFQDPPPPPPPPLYFFSTAYTSNNKNQSFGARQAFKFQTIAPVSIWDRPGEMQ